MKKNYSIYMNGKVIETRLTKEEAKIKADRYHREDLYELSIGYGFPNGMPKYEVIKA